MALLWLLHSDFVHVRPRLSHSVGVEPINPPNSGKRQPFRSISCATSVLSARARPAKKTIRCCDGWWCRHMPRQRTTGIHRLSFTEASRCGSARAPRCPRVGAPPTAPFLLPSNSCWSSSRSGSRALVRADGTVALHGSRGTCVASGPTGGRDGLSSGRSRSASARRDSR